VIQKLRFKVGWSTVQTSCRQSQIPKLRQSVC